MTIYLPDDLSEQLKEITDLNVSAVCQAALRNEIAHRSRIAELDRGMSRVIVDATETHGGEVAFTGREIAFEMNGYLPLTAYLTAQHRIAVHVDDAHCLHVFESFAELSGDQAWRDGHPKLLSDIAQETGETHIIELDI